MKSKILISLTILSLLAVGVVTGCSNSSATSQQIASLQNQVNSLSNSLASTQQQLAATQQQLTSTQQQLVTTQQQLAEAKSKLQQQNTYVPSVKTGTVYQSAIIYRTYPYVYYQTYPYTTPWYWYPKK